LACHAEGPAKVMARVRAKGDREAKAALKLAAKRSRK